MVVDGDGVFYATKNPDVESGVSGGGMVGIRRILLVERCAQDRDSAVQQS